MRCKHHPNRDAKHFCTGCGIPLCDDCSEETRDGDVYCFQCAMLSSVSAVSTSIKDKREKSAEKKLDKKKKWGPFHYFVTVSGVLILVMWGVILFGGQKAPAGTMDYSNNQRVFLFMVDGAVKRYAHYEGNKYPPVLADLIPKYLQLGDNKDKLLNMLSYRRDRNVGYQLSLVNPAAGEMNVTITAKGIKYEGS